MFGGYLVLVVLNGLKQNTDSSGKLDVTKFRRGLQVTLIVTGGLILFATVVTLIFDSAFYDGRCPATYYVPTTETYKCSFGEFYIRSTLYDFYTGMPAAFPTR
jgi:hypothetical protein